jgi:hypothetical protein
LFFLGARGGQADHRHNRGTTGNRRDTASHPTHDFVLTSKDLTSKDLCQLFEDQSGERNSNPMF